LGDGMDSHFHTCTGWSQLFAMARIAGEQTDQMICLYQQQLGELQRQSIDTHGFAEASTYQAIAVAQSESAHVEPTPGQPAFIPSKPIQVPYQLVNHGKTRAEKVRFVADAALWPRNGGDPSFSYSKDSARASSESMEAGETSTSSLKGTTAIRVLDHGHPILADTEITSAYQKGAKDVVTWGKLTYTDVFGVNHWAHFCTVFAQHQIGELIQPSHKGCSAYNKSDENQILASKYEPLLQRNPRHKSRVRLKNQIRPPGSSPVASVVICKLNWIESGVDIIAVSGLVIAGAGTIAAIVAAAKSVTAVRLAREAPTKEDLKRVEDHLAEVDGHLHEQNKRELLSSLAERVSITVTTQQGPMNEPLTLLLKLEDRTVTLLRIELVNSLGMLSGASECLPFGDPPDPLCFTATVTQQTAQQWFNTGNPHLIRAFMRIGDREPHRSFSVFVTQNIQGGAGTWLQTISVSGSC
jgi:hypothetical protein